jgi:predicted membrane protein
MSYRMRHRRQLNSTTHVVLGILLAALGLLFTLDNMHLIHARQVLRYWPAALIVVGLVQIAQSKAAGGWIGGAIWIVIGATMLGNRLYFFDVNIFDFWPLILVLIGVRMAAQAYHADSPELSDTDAGSVVSAISVLGGVERRITSQDFKRAEITAFLGGGKLDLTEAKLAGGQAVIHVLAIMGGFQVIVPSTWNVILEATPFMGGIDDRRRPPATADPAAPRLILRGFVMMGGVEIKD